MEAALTMTQNLAALVHPDPLREDPKSRSLNGCLGFRGWGFRV